MSIAKIIFETDSATKQLLKIYVAQKNITIKDFLNEIVKEKLKNYDPERQHYTNEEAQSSETIKKSLGKSKQYNFSKEELREIIKKAKAGGDLTQLLRMESNKER